MGLTINGPRSPMTISDIILQLGISGHRIRSDVPVLAGGPVEISRGFLLHTPELVNSSSLLISEDCALTTTVEGLKSLFEGNGPRRCIFALGYTGWAPGQLDAEIQANGWLVTPANEEIIFDGEVSSKWHRALGLIGVDPSLLSSTAGHA